MTFVNLEHLTLQYPVYNIRSFSARSTFLRISTGGLLEQDSAKVVVVTALRDLSLRLESGDRVGVIGHNGAGKSTLMRVIAGIFPPTHGVARVQGRIGTLFELGAGYDPELTGFENMQRVGRLLGMHPREIEAKAADIVEFAELGEFMSLPVRTYSAGMQTRLLFAIATASQPDILLVDEVFGAGDASFVERAVQRIRELASAAGIMMLASHSDPLILELCNKCLWLEHGTVREFGPAKEVLAHYRSDSAHASKAA